MVGPACSLLAMLCQCFDLSLKMRDAVENLAKAYLEIRREGCIQFDDLVVVIHCAPLTTRRKVAIEVCLQSVGETMHGYKTDKTALEHCHDLYNYLKECLQKWRDSMDNMRRYVSIGR